MTRLTPTARRKANAALVRAGLDGNGNFQDITDAVQAIERALATEKLQLEPAVARNNFPGDSGSRRFTVYAADSDQPLSGTSLYLTWATLENRIEVIAYLT